MFSIMMHALMLPDFVESGGLTTRVLAKVWQGYLNWVSNHMITQYRFGDECLKVE